MVQRGFIDVQLVHLMLREITDAQLGGTGHRASLHRKAVGQHLG